LRMLYALEMYVGLSLLPTPPRPSLTCSRFGHHSLHTTRKTTIEGYKPLYRFPIYRVHGVSLPTYKKAFQRLPKRQYIIIQRQEV
jgi:hypothetical protein